MKKLLLVSVLSASLCSCSLLQRHDDMEREEPGAAAQAEENGDSEGPLFTPNGQEINSAPAARSAGGNEAEVSRLNTKIAALETKVDVLSANLERIQAQKAQPVIQAEPQAHLAAPVSDATEIQDQTKTQVSAAPSRPSRVATVAHESEEPAAKTSTTAAEREFRVGMQLFQNGQNLEAASRFALMAKKFPHHLLAAHALYWAGEAASRGQQWAIAVDNWSELEKHYPRSAYMPEALAGLAKAHEAQGEAAKAKLYRTLLARSFPKSPVAMKSGAEPMDAAPARRISRAGVSPAPGEEEPAPIFEEEGGTPASSGAGGEPPTESQ